MSQSEVDETWSQVDDILCHVRGLIGITYGGHEIDSELVEDTRVRMFVALSELKADRDRWKARAERAEASR